jgi:cyanophycin synthetase
MQAAVFESNARQILTEGLCYDKCQVGIVTDMEGLEELAEFHIHDADAMTNVVRTQVDVILPQGVAVLNAAIPAVAELAGLCDGEVIFYAADATLPTMTAHLAANGRAVYLRDGVITLGHGSKELALLGIDALRPETATYPDNVLAAVAAAWCLEVPDDLIAACLRTFDRQPKKALY